MGHRIRLQPDWVFVNAQGATIINAPTNSVIGRYAYMIYDEGGQLDMNAAGYPSPTTVLQYGRKGSLAFADLTALGGFSATSVDNVVGWRNYASAQPTGTLNPPGSNLSFTPTTANTYYNFILSDPSNLQLTNYFTNSFLTTSQAAVFNNQTDQPVAARQELLKLRSGMAGAGIGFVNALQYAGTFSREALSKIPQWKPATPDSINPNFQTLLATGSFTRNDGTTASAGEYLVNRRFLLQRLNWLTYQGPSATRTIPTTAPSLGDPNYDMWLLTRPDVSSIRFGLTSSFLQKGTDANILKYFGLVWDATNERWNYTSPSGGSLATSIATLGTLTSSREPDFFELLKAGILNGSLGDSSPSYPGLPTTHQQSAMLHILTIGANLIAQSRADSYPVRIACTVGGTTMEAIGSPRLPYINSLAACPVGVTANSGGMNWFLIPNLWNPFRDTWDLIEANAGNTGNKPLSTPGYLRPPVRITIKGTGVGGSTSVGFGTTPTVSASGWVSAVTPFSTVTINTSSQTLITGDSTYGRDGFLQAMRIGASDISGLISFDPKTLGSITPSWNKITPPTNDSSARTDNYAVFRLSASIPVGTTGYPVLALNPGFQMTMDYQSLNGTWVPYSFLQGNNATTTWIASPLNVTTKYSQYGTPGGNTAPTIVKEGTTTTTRWDTGSAGVAALAQAPMFAKGDPRSMRYSTQIGALTLVANSAGVTGSLWPNGYTPTPPPMTTGPTPTPTPTATPGGSPSPTPIPPVNGPNPATLGDNVGAGNGANPYNELTGDNWRPVMMNRPFRSVGEMGYGFRDQPFRTLSFSSINSPDAGLLDLFSVNDYTNSSGTRGGVVNLNSRQAPALAAVLTNTIAREDTPRNNAGTSPSPSPLSSATANSVGTNLTLSTIGNPVVNRTDVTTLVANLPNSTGVGPSTAKTQREAVVRALGEVDQTRTWNLFIDVIAQSGRYPPNATSFENGFVVQGEQRYWVHVAIDRFTGQVIDKQIEVVTE
jgi:hypothetical protein